MNAIKSAAGAHWKKILLLFLTGLVTAYVFQRKTSSPEARRLTPEVETVTLSESDFGHSIKAPGTITFLEKASISARIPGRLESYDFDQGEEVKKGTALARLERLEMELQLRQAEAALKSAIAQEKLTAAQYGQARRNIERRLKQIESSQAGIVEARAQFIQSRQALLNKVEIYKMGGISKKELQSLHAQYLNGMSRYYQARKGHQIEMVGFRTADLEQNGIKIDEAILKDTAAKTAAFVDFNTEVEKGNLEVARESKERALIEVQNLRRLLEETVLRSPIDGVIASRSIEIGEEVKVSEPLFTVVRMDELLVSTNVAENDIPYLRKEQSVTFTVDALNGESFTGKVKLISPVVDLATRTTEVRVHVKNTDRRLAPGMFVRCEIETTERRKGLLVPESAFIDPVDDNSPQPYETSVFVVQDGRVFRRSVQVGMRFEGGRELLSGLEPGESIAVSGVAYLKEGTQVKPRTITP
ncbi:efflux transporter, RND family, MFP subunit [Leptonema illini DSM 21528]|uniref:Efflux transporter, RND family, MFP subunit n=1 Tax=Leptonema illini DSM 21528 TaxID=929563 RepID=H2CKP5_9LEPT|nr:efflux transporter, RND family, MFP subunit [Leptonema illini DSM 21528]